VIDMSGGADDDELHLRQYRARVGRTLLSAAFDLEIDLTLKLVSTSKVGNSTSKAADKSVRSTQTW
jgi:hypothetical protein